MKWALFNLTASESLAPVKLSLPRSRWESFACKEREWSIQMVYTMWYTTPIYQYICVIYSIPCMVYTMLYIVYHMVYNIRHLIILVFSRFSASASASARSTSKLRRYCKCAALTCQRKMVRNMSLLLVHIANALQNSIWQCSGPCVLKFSDHPKRMISLTCYITWYITCYIWYINKHTGSAA